MSLREQIVVFDVDNTLAESRASIDESMAGFLCDLLNIRKVGVISGVSFEELIERIANKLNCQDKLGNLYIMPTAGTELYEWRVDKWSKVYDYSFDEGKKKRVVEELLNTVKVPEDRFGEFVEDRGDQITYSALGARAPVEEKAKWDPDRSKRKEIVDMLLPKLPGVSIKIGGRTSIDFTESGFDKAFGVKKLLEHLSFLTQDVVFIGDALDAGGNDSVVKSLGIKTIKTTGPRETRDIIKGFLEF